MITSCRDCPYLSLYVTGSEVTYYKCKFNYIDRIYVPSTEVTSLEISELVPNEFPPCCEIYRLDESIKEFKKVGKKTWTFAQAKQDYKNRHPFRFKKDCENCVFHEEDYAHNIVCSIKEIYILFNRLSAKFCRYYTQK